MAQAIILKPQKGILWIIYIYSYSFYKIIKYLLQRGGGKSNSEDQSRRYVFYVMQANAAVGCYRSLSYFSRTGKFHIYIYIYFVCFYPHLPKRSLQGFVSFLYWIYEIYYILHTTVADYSQPSVDKLPFLPEFNFPSSSFFTLCLYLNAGHALSLGPSKFFQ